MKRFLYYTILTMLLVVSAYGEEAPRESWYAWNAQTDIISITISDCSVEILPASNDYMIYRSYGQSALNVISDNDTMYIDISMPSPKHVDHSTAYLYLPMAEQCSLRIYASHANVSLTTAFKNMDIEGIAQSNIHLPLMCELSQSIHAKMTDGSYLEFLSHNTSRNFRMDCTIWDEKSSIDIFGKYPDLVGKGEYHYIKGNKSLSLDIILDFNSHLVFSNS